MKAAGHAARPAPIETRNSANASGSSQGLGTALSRRAKPVLDLPQLELDCMKVLWVRGEASVRQIWTELSARRSLAYTTIETILDRLARKGVVTRVRNGKAFLYRPHFTAEQARHFALTKLLNNFFGGSVRQLAALLENPDAMRMPVNPADGGVNFPAPAPPPFHPESRRVHRGTGRVAQGTRASRPSEGKRARRREVTPAGTPPIDESLL